MFDDGDWVCRVLSGKQVEKEIDVKLTKRRREERLIKRVTPYLIHPRRGSHLTKHDVGKRVYLGERLF